MKKKILFVDDEEMILEVYTALLEDEEEFEIFTALNGEEGFSIFKKENIQVVFTDLKMPIMNGIEMCKKIRKKNPICLIHAVTGFPTLFELAECREIGFDDYFTKPISTVALRKAIDYAFDKLDRWKHS